jgi:iron complex transport system substrate-binding protein
MSQKRIVSLLPACTEIVCALGCGGQIVGRSHECDFPPEVQSVPACTAPRLDTGASSAEIDSRIKSLSQNTSSIYEVNAALLAQLRPDLILTQTQCDVCAVSRQELEKVLPPPPAPQPEIVSIAPARLADVWRDIQTIAAALGVAEGGQALLWRLKNRVVDIIQKTCMVKRRLSVVCLEWLNPLMASGHWMPEMVQLAGGQNLFGEPGKAAPRLEWKDIVAAEPDVIVLTPCGFNLARTRSEAKTLESQLGWAKLRAVKSKNIFVADGNAYFNRPGPRIVESLEILAEILHPKLFSFGHEGKGWGRL